MYNQNETMKQAVHGQQCLIVFIRLKTLAKLAALHSLVLMGLLYIDILEITM